MASVTLTAALRSNLLSLQGTQTLLDQTQLRLATGRKVNSALDNPSSFFSAQALNNRAGDLSGLLDAMGQGIQVLKAADQGITTLTTLVQQAQAIAKNAQNEVSNSGLARSGDISNTQVVAASAYSGNITGTGGASAGTFILTAKDSAGTTTSTATVTIVASETLGQLATSINGFAGFSAQVVDGGVSGSSRIEIRATNGQSLTITNGTGSIAAFLAGGANGSGAAGTTAGVTGGGAAIANNTLIASTANAPDQISLENQYNTIRTQIDALITDSGYQGTNLLNGDTLKVQFNEKNTSFLNVTGVTFNTKNLGITFTAGTTFQNATNIASSLSEITSSLTQLRNQAQTFGNNLNVIQTRQDFTSNLINTLKAGSDALTLADKNEEGANLLSLQTSQQLGIQALSLASQANQSVLRLFS